jgi:hypothetical protein
MCRHSYTPYSKPGAAWRGLAVEAQFILSLEVVDLVQVLVLD